MNNLSFSKQQLDQAVLHCLLTTPLYSSSDDLVNSIKNNELLPKYFFQTHEFVSPVAEVSRSIKRLKSRVGIVQRYYKSDSMNQAISLWILKEYDKSDYYPIDSWAVHETYDQRMRD